ncbi:MAG: hypothetical protein ACLT0Y_08480 [Christensenellales bacterium]
MTPLYAVAWPIVWLISKVFFFGREGQKNMPKNRAGGGVCNMCTRWTLCSAMIATDRFIYEQIWCFKEILMC